MERRNPMREVDPVDLVETIREGLLVLEPDLTVRFANSSFCNTFAVTLEDTVGRKLYELGEGQWDIPELRSLIEAVLPEHRLSRPLKWTAFSRRLGDG